LNRSLVFIAAALLLWGFGEGMFFNFVPIYLDTQFDLSKSQIGLVLGIFGFSMALTHIPAGRLADRLGRRPLLIIAWMTGLTAALLMGFGVALPMFLAGLFMYGLTAFVSSPLSSYVTAARGKWSVGTALSLTTVAFSTGMVFGPVTGGWIGEQFGMRTSFLVAAALFMISTFCIALIAAQPIDRHDPAAPPLGLLKNQRFLVFLGVLGFAVFAMYLAVPLTPNFLESVRKLSLSQNGLIFTAGALGNAFMALILSRANPRYGFLVAQALVALFALSIWKGTGLPVFALGYFLLGGFRAARPMAMAQARDLVHDSQMGLTYGTMETVNAIVFILTPPLAGLLFDWDPAFIYPLSIGLLVVSILVSYLFSPRKESHA
jgi:predicted MFS family arabinose efflux permease